MKSRVEMRLRLGGTCRLDRTGRFSAGELPSRWPSAMWLSLSLKASEDVTGSLERPRRLPHPHEGGIGAFARGNRGLD